MTELQKLFIRHKEAGLWDLCYCNEYGKYDFCSICSRHKECCKHTPVETYELDDELDTFIAGISQAIKEFIQSREGK